MQTAIQGWVRGLRPAQLRTAGSATTEPASGGGGSTDADQAGIDQDLADVDALLNEIDTDLGQVDQDIATDEGDVE